MSQDNPADLTGGQFRGSDETGEFHDVQGLHAPIMREKADPRDGYEPIPTWTAGVFGIIVFMGGIYIDRFCGDFRSDVYEERRPAIGALAKKADKPTDPIAVGKRLYAAQGCVACHQATGVGQPGAIPPLAKSDWVLGSTARINRILLQGMQGEVKVVDQTYNGNMPAFGVKLKDEQIAAVLTYIRQEWGNKAEAISTELVTAAREATKDQSNPWSSADLLAITKDDEVKESTEKSKDSVKPAATKK